uniref:Uncharacterized protein n=1 Tax=Aegilops tauschii subsp. strangulata TaxID=200361 RepID=A0A453EBC7_AEGTS
MYNKSLIHDARRALPVRSDLSYLLTYLHPPPLSCRQAFEETWDSACRDSGGATLYVPEGRTFLLGETKLQGPCKSPITLQVKNIRRSTTIRPSVLHHPSSSLVSSTRGISITEVCACAGGRGHRGAKLPLDPKVVNKPPGLLQGRQPDGGRHRADRRPRRAVVALLQPEGNSSIPGQAKRPLLLHSIFIYTYIVHNLTPLPLSGSHRNATTGHR